LWRGEVWLVRELAVLLVERALGFHGRSMDAKIAVQSVCACCGIKIKAAACPNCGTAKLNTANPSVEIKIAVQHAWVPELGSTNRETS
jgi:hypothetical protein